MDYQGLPSNDLSKQSLNPLDDDGQVRVLHKLGTFGVQCIQTQIVCMLV